MKKVLILACIFAFLTNISANAAWQEFTKTSINKCTSSQIIDSTLVLYNGDVPPKQVEVNLSDKTAVESTSNIMYVSTSTVNNEIYRCGLNINTISGIVEKSIDGGKTWLSVLNAQKNQVCFKFHISGTGQISVVGYNASTNKAFISYSDNNNAFTTKSFSEYSKFLSISESDGSYFVGTDNGKILKMNSTFTEVSVCADVCEDQIKNMNVLNGDLIAFSDCGMIARKAKSSDVWEQYTFINDDSFLVNNTLVLNDSVVLVCGKSESDAKGIILSSRDSGRTWKTEFTSSEFFASLNSYKDSVIFAVTNNGTVYQESIEYLAAEDQWAIPGEAVETLIVPENDNCSIFVKDMPGPIELNLYNFSGEKISTQILHSQNDMLNFEFPQSVPFGVYFIGISNGTNTKTIKVLYN